MSFIFYLIVLFQNVAEPLALCMHCTGTYVATEHVIGQQLFYSEKATVLQLIIGYNTAWIYITGTFTKNVITNRTAILQIWWIDCNYAHESSVSLQNTCSSTVHTYSLPISIKSLYMESQTLFFFFKYNYSHCWTCFCSFTLNRSASCLL